MKPIYFFRHQSHGVLYDMPFIDKPTDAQAAEVRQLMAARYGVECPVNGGELWLRVVSYEALSSSESVFATLKQRGDALVDDAAEKAKAREEGALVEVRGPKLAGKLTVG